MSLWRQLTRGLSVLTNRTAADRELDDEVRHFQEEAADAYAARGLSPADAARAARLEMGNATLVRERVRDHGWESILGTLVADARLAGRMLRKSPVFTLVVVFVISLGSGAVTTIFSGMNALVLRPLPGVPDVAGLLSVRPARTDGTAAEQGSYDFYRYLHDRAHTLDTAAWGRVALTITAGDQGTAAYGNMVSGNYFDVLGVRPALGRFFTEDEARAPGAHPVVVLSHPFWRSRLDGDPAAPGRMILVNGIPITVIGVAPEGFEGIYTGLRADAWVPLTMQPQLRPRSNLTHASWLWLFGRLREGATMEASRQELSALAVARARDRGETFPPDTAPSVRVAALTGLPNGEAGMLLGFMSVLLGAAALLLLIAGVNVAAMLSARYAARRRELAVRAALGAGRARLLRQLLTEVLTLFLLGAIGGFVIAQLATAALERLPLPQNVPVSLELSPDIRVLAFAIAISLLAGLIFGLAPALQAARRDVASRLRDDSAGAGQRRTFLSRALIVGQIALSLVLLVAAGLFIRALDRGARIDPGFKIDGVATASLEPEAWGYGEARARRFYGLLRDRVSELPGVLAVSYTGRLPLMLGSSPDTITAADAEIPVHTASVDVDYFGALELPLLHGRPFLRSDGVDAGSVAVINETLARKLWPDGAVGRTFRFRDAQTTVVGIARDAKYATLDETTPSFVYFPLAQRWLPNQALLVRTAGDPAQFAPAIQGAMLAIDPALPRARVSTLRRATAIVLLPQRAAAIITGALGFVGLLLAAVGLYGIMAFSAGRRTREIGIRMALGARRSTVVRMMVGEGLRLAGAGIVIGVVLAAGATHLISGWLFNINPIDGATFLGMSALFVIVASLASYLPARRAVRADPLAALRAE
ncbi:MAG: ABC transporter permease [Acidobacteriota bacterium]|nr:ABC transporter permease [Acidobacteriota bacterium]